MRKHLVVVSAVAMAAASAGPAAAAPADTFAPGTSDAAQTASSSPVAVDLRGDAARESGAVGTDLRGDAARESGAVAADLRGDAARAAAEPAVPVPVSVDIDAPAADGLDWTSVGLGAGGAIVAAITAGGVVLIARRGVRVGASR